MKEFKQILYKEEKDVVRSNNKNNKLNTRIQNYNYEKKLSKNIYFFKT
jgi:hypothetical protein